MSTLKVTNIEPQSGSIVHLNGDIVGTGSIEFNGVVWPEEGAEKHLIKTDPFILNLDSGNRNYEYLGVALEYGTASLGGYKHNSLSIYAFDNHENPTYGAEFNVGPLRSHMRIFPSGSTNDLANVSVSDNENGSSIALVYATEVQILNYTGSLLKLGNAESNTFLYSRNFAISASTSVTGSLNISDNLSTSAHSNIDGTLTALNAATSSYATSATHISIGELKALVSSSATYAEFTGSVLAL